MQINVQTKNFTLLEIQGNVIGQGRTRAQNDA